MFLGLPIILKHDATFEIFLYVVFKNDMGLMLTQSLQGAVMSEKWNSLLYCRHLFFFYKPNWIEGGTSG